MYNIYSHTPIIPATIVAVLGPPPPASPNSSSVGDTAGESQPKVHVCTKHGGGMQFHYCQMYIILQTMRAMTGCSMLYTTTEFVIT